MPHPQSNPKSDLPDPLNDSQHLQLDNVEDLLSRLADQEINRMIGPNGTQYELLPVDPDSSSSSLPKIVKRPTPVQELDAQLGSFFGGLQSRELAPPAPVVEQEPVEAVVRPVARVEAPPAKQRIDNSLNEARSRQALIAPIDPPAPAIVRMLAWLNGPVMDMSPRGRLAVSIVSLLVFAGSVSALGYVLMLRQG
jgi:hypothetical protein